MLYDKTAQVYRMARNAKMVSSWTLQSEISCNIQPYGSQDGMGGIPAYNQYKLYTDYMTIKEGDKIECLGEIYIVKDVEDWKGVLRTFNKVIVEKSRGS